MSAAAFDEDAFRERNHLAGEISQHVFDAFVGEFRPFHFSSGEYELLGEEDCIALGYDSYDPCGPLIMRRKSDGKCFEVEFEATIHPVPTEAERQERAGQLALGGAS